MKNDRRRKRERERRVERVRDGKIRGYETGYRGQWSKYRKTE